MGSQKENTRICCMCGSSPSKDPSITLHRFPKPGSKNALRCELWAKYCFPNEAWSSPKFQDGLHSKHKMLCSKHFMSSCFIENKLFRTAAPGVQWHQAILTRPTLIKPRCINCWIAIPVTQKYRYKASHMDLEIISVIEEWIARQVINEDYLCHECVSLLILECNNRNEGNIGERQLGHDSVCVCCGISIARRTGRRSHHLKCVDAKWTYIMKIIRPLEITPTFTQHPVEPAASLSHQLHQSDDSKHAQAIRTINEGAHVKVENTAMCDDNDVAVDESDTLVDSNVENTDIFADEDNAVDDSDTLVDSNVCRVCLTFDVKMYDLKDIELREMFQNVTGIAVTENNHSILERLCWECAGRLKAAAGFRNKALLSDALLRELANTREQIQKSYITSIKENADYLKSAGTLSVAEVFRTVEIEPQNDSVPPISENNDTEIVENIVKNEPIDLEESVFEDGHYQMDVEDNSITEDEHIICPNTGETNPITVINVPFIEDTTNSASSSPQVEPKKRILGYLHKTSSDCDVKTKKPVIKISKSDLISKIVYTKSNPVISPHRTLIGDGKLKNINVKVGGICKKTLNLKLVKKSKVKRNTSTEKECMSLEKK